MRKDYARCRDADRDNKRSWLDQTTFITSNDQWEQAVKNARGDERIALTFNQLAKLAESVVGQYRQSKLAVSVQPDGHADQAAADLRAGLIRGIEYRSKAADAYTTAFKHAVHGGLGWFRVLTEYDGDDTFDTVLRVRPVANPLAVSIDPAARRLTREDAEYAFVEDTVPRDEFAAKYPDADTSWLDSASRDDKLAWMSDGVKIVEYFRKKRTKIEVVRFESGLEAVIDSPAVLDTFLSLGERVQKTRPGERVTVEWFKCTGGSVLERAELPIPYLPLVPVLGEEVNLEGKVSLRGALYYALGAQRMLNYWLSTATEQVSQSPRPKVAMTPDMLEGHADTWNPRSPTTVALYNADGSGAPQPLAPPPPPNADLLMATGAMEQVKATSGIFSSQVGEQVGGSSGKAINSLQRAGSNVTYLFTDNLTAAVAHGGTILNAWLPHVYDAERVLLSLDAEEAVSPVAVNRAASYDPFTGAWKILNALGTGKFAVTVTAGPAFATQQQEFLQTMTQILQVLPQVGQAAPDLLVKALPVQGKDEIAARLKKLLPPGVAGDDDDPQKQAEQQQAVQMQQQAQQQQMALQQAAAQAELAKQQAETQRQQAEARQKQAAAALDAQRLDLDRYKAEADARVTDAEVALKHEELLLKRAELALRRQQLNSPATGASAPAVPAE